MKFNLSRTPWWGGRFKRTVGLVNQCLYKAAGKAKHTKQELEVKDHDRGRGMWGGDTVTKVTIGGGGRVAKITCYKCK